MQWFQNKWPKNAEKIIVNTNSPVCTKFIDVLFNQHPEFKAVYDKRQKVNFVISLDKIYSQLSQLEKLTRPLFPTLPYPIDWVCPCLPTSAQDEDNDNNDVEEDMEVSGEQEQTTIQTQVTHAIRPSRLLNKKIVKKIGRGMTDSYSEWCICMSYYMSKYCGYNYPKISKTTGMHVTRIAVLMNADENNVYAKYKNKMKHMSKIELHNYISTLEVKNMFLLLTSHYPFWTL